MSHSDQYSWHPDSFPVLDNGEFADHILYVELMKNVSIVKQADVNDTYSLPEWDGNENHVFDRGKH